MEEILDGHTIDKKRTPKFNWIVFWIYLTIIFTGFLFKAMYWPGAGVLLIIGTCSSFMHPLSNLIVFGIKNKMNNAVLLVTGIWFFLNFTKTIIWYGGYETEWFLSFLVLSLIFFIPHSIFRLWQRKKRKNQPN